MNNYYQQPDFNQNNFNEAAMRNMYFINKAKLERKQIRTLGNILGIVITAFVAVQFISSFVLQGFGLYDLYYSSSLFQTCYNIIAIDFFGIVLPFGVMALLNKKRYESEFIPTAKLPFGRLCLWVGFGMLCCICADYIVGIMTVIFSAAGHELIQPEMPETNSLLTCIAGVIGTAVVPAVCEEFAMRCCGLGMLRKYGKAFGVICISMLFGLMHGNVIQFVFATLVGIILGFVTVKTNSVIPAVLIHMFNNGMSVCSDVVTDFIGEKAGETSTYICFLFWFAVGSVCTIALAVKGYFKKSVNTQNEPYSNSLGIKISSFFFVPGMIVPFLFFVIMTITSIE